MDLGTMRAWLLLWVLAGISCTGRALGLVNGHQGVSVFASSPDLGRRVGLRGRRGGRWGTPCVIMNGEVGTVGVVGASGNVGRLVALRLADIGNGLKVKAIARDSARAEGFLRDIAPEVANLRNPKSAWHVGRDLR